MELQAKLYAPTGPDGELVEDPLVQKGPPQLVLGLLTRMMGLLPIEGMQKARENGPGITEYQADLSKRIVWVHPSDFIEYGDDAPNYGHVVTELVSALPDQLPPWPL